MSLVLNGSSQYAAKSALSLSYPFTIAGWMKADSNSATQILASAEKHSNADYNVIQSAGSVSGDPIRVGTYGTEWKLADTTSGYSTGTWTHFAGVWASDASRTSFIAGGSKGTNTESQTAVAATFMVGAYKYGATAGHFDGKLAHIAVWSVALSDENIALLASGISPLSVDSAHLVSYWPLFDDANDDQGTNHLTVANSPSFDTDDHPSVVVAYEDMAGTVSAASAVSGALKTDLLVDLAGTIAGTSGASGSLLSRVTLDEKALVKRIVAAGNDQLWYEDAMAAGAMVELVAARNDVDTSDQLVLFELGQKVFVVNGAKLKVADFRNVKIATSAVGSHYPDPGNILTGGNSKAQMVVEYITAKSGAVTIYGKRTTTETFASGETVTGTDDDSNAISFTLSADETAPPHWYDWKPYANDTAAYGTLPGKAYLGCAYRGRAVLSGNPDYPNQFYMSREGNPFDFNIYATDAQRATAGGVGDLGMLGDMPRALVPHHDDALMIGCANSVTVLRGNPTDGGYLDHVNAKIGVFGQSAWTFDADGNLYFWGTGGVYHSPKGFSAFENITSERYPDLIQDEGADPSTHRVVFGYDPGQQGIQISVTKLADGSSSSYWLDLRTKALFPDDFQTLHGAYSMFYYDANDVDNKCLIVGCTDGYTRRFSATAKNDDGSAIDSYVDYGPIQLGSGPDGEGVVFSVDAELGGGASGGTELDSNSVPWRLWADDSADGVNEKLSANSAPNVGGTFTAPGRRRGQSVKRKVKGVYAGIKLRNNSLNESWAFEKMIVGVRPTGRKK